MSIEIGRFITHCKAPSRAKVSKELLEHVVRQRFVSECGVQLRSQPEFHSQVIRIRRLSIRLTITDDKLDADNLARAWAVVFFRKLFTAIAAANASGPDLVCAPTRAEWLAGFIVDVISGSAGGRWEYEEFKDALELATPECVLSVLSAEPWEIVDVLLAIEESKKLDQLIRSLGDLALEKLFSVIARSMDQQTNELTIDDLITIGGLVRSQADSRGILGTRSSGLRIFVTLNGTHRTVRDRVLTPRLVLHALMTLDALIELTQSLPPNSFFYALAPETLARRTGPALHPAVLEVIARIWTITTGPGEAEKQKLEALLELLIDLNPLPTTESAVKNIRWVSSQCAGLMLLVGLLDRLGWAQRIRSTALGARLDSRVINFFLAALALRLLGRSVHSQSTPWLRGEINSKPTTETPRNQINERLDPGLLLFAGWPDAAVADLAAFRNFLSSLSGSEQRELIDLFVDSEQREQAGLTDEICRGVPPWTPLTLLAPRQGAPTEGRPYELTFDCLADVLIREFASRVRGFHNAQPQYVVKTFFAQPGRIFISDDSIRVVLQSNPFQIALRISSMDEPVESVSWLGGRRLEFQLEGL